MADIFASIAILCILVLWFGLMTAYGVSAYKQIRYEYLDLGLASGGGFLLMLAITLIVASWAIG
jgi:hypothetical protein